MNEKTIHTLAHVLAMLVIAVAAAGLLAILIVILQWIWGALNA